MTAHAVYRSMCGFALLGFLILAVVVTGVERYSKVETAIGWAGGIVMSVFAVGLIGWMLT